MVKTIDNARVVAENFAKFRRTFGKLTAGKEHLGWCEMFSMAKSMAGLSDAIK